MNDKLAQGNFLELLGNLPGIAQAFSGKSAVSKAGAIGSAIGAASNFIVPGLGAVLSPLLGGLAQMIGKKDDEAYALNEHYNQVNTVTNPYQLKDGGVVGNEDNFKFKGKTHAEGGINISKDGLPVAHSNIEVENGENFVDVTINGKRIKYVFSDTLKI